MKTETQFIDGAFKSGLNPQQVSQAVRVYRTKNRPTLGSQALGFAKEVVSPFVRTGKNIGGAGYEVFRATKSALGDKNAYVNQDTGSTVQNPFLNEKELTKASQPLSLKKGSGLRQQIGDSANVASFAVPFGKGANFATKALIPGATVGALTSATGDASLKDVAMGAAGGAVFAGALRGASNVFKKIPKSLRSQSEDVITKGIGNPAKQVNISNKSGKSMGQFLKEYNILDRSPDTAADVTSMIGSQYDDLALKSGKSARMADIIKPLDDELMSLQNSVGKYSDANIAKAEEIFRRKQQILESVGADASQSPITTQIKDVALFRRKALDPDIPKSMFGLDSKGSGKAQGAKATRDILKKVINKSDSRLKQLGLDYGMAKGVEDILTKAQSRGNNRQIINFSKLGTAGLGGLVGGLPGAAGGFIFEEVSKHPLFIRTLSDVLSSGATGQAAINKVLANPNIQQLVLQVGSRAGGFIGSSVSRSLSAATPELPEVKRESLQSNSYPPIIPPTLPVKPQKLKPLKYKSPDLQLKR